MIGWLIIIALVIAGVFALKMNHMRHRVWILLIIMFGLFLSISITMVYKQNEIKLNSAEDFFKAGEIYLGWLGHSFNNLKALTGNAVNMDWTATNGTFFKSDQTKNKNSNPVKNKTAPKIQK
jgi:hypothetical protein